MPPPTRAVVIVMFDGLQSLDLTGPLEVFAGANTYLAEHGPVYQISVASLGATAVRTSSGLAIAADTDLRTVQTMDTLLVPGGEGTRSTGPATEELVGWLRQHAPAARRVASVCTGAFLLARAGLLAGRCATTHWAYADSLARQFPEVSVDPEPIYLQDGPFITSAGVTAGIDLSLALVEQDAGREAALSVARRLVVFLRRPGGQAQFSTQLRAQFAQRRPLRDVQQWISQRPADDLSVGRLAARAGLSPRQFARSFTAETGVTPGQYVGRVRLEAARRELEDTAGGIEQVARCCGYGTPEAMRRAFIKALGVSPAGYRQRFRAAAPAGSRATTGRNLRDANRDSAL
jgi:transcriptional regulator GlxA family with amidase domain